MNTGLTRGDLIAFQDDIKERFLRGEIRHPIHLCDPNQIEHLLPIFEQIHPHDWLFTTYRGMFHWLLKGVPPNYLRQWIIDHGAMNFCDRERRIVSSAIVGGCLPIAVGTALGIKRQEGTERVWCFLGDMAARTGGAREAMEYAFHWDLPIRFILEDNGLSTNTPTELVWGGEDNELAVLPDQTYVYERTVPHVGVGRFVVFS